MTTQSRGVRLVGMISVAVVAIVAAVVSYAHMQDVAEKAGEGWRSWLEPLSVDGLLVGASLVLYVRRTSRFAWLAVTVGILVSLVANLAAAHPSLISRLVSAWPAVALALSYETLLTLVRRSHTEPAEPAEPIAAISPAIVTTPPLPQLEPTVDNQPQDHSAQKDDDHNSADLLDRARQIVNDGQADGVRIGRTRLARQLGIGETDARRLLNQITRGAKPHLVSREVSTSDESESDEDQTPADPYFWMRATR